MEFIPSPRSNKQLLVFEQHIYCEQKKLAGNIILWECVNRRNRNACSARIKTLNGILHGRAPDHRCQPDPAKIQTMKGANEAACTKYDGKNKGYFKWSSPRTK